MKQPGKYEQETVVYRQGTAQVEGTENMPNGTGYSATGIGGKTTAATGKGTPGVEGAHIKPPSGQGKAAWPYNEPQREDVNPFHDAP